MLPLRYTYGNKMENNLEITTENDFEIFPMVALRDKVIFPTVRVNFDAGREMSVNAIKKASEYGDTFVVFTQTCADKVEVSVDEVYKTGTLVKIISISHLPSNGVRVEVEGIERVELISATAENCFMAKIKRVPLTCLDTPLENAYGVDCRENFNKVIAYFPPPITKDLLKQAEKFESIEDFAYLALNTVQLKNAKKQAIYELPSFLSMIKAIDQALVDELEINSLVKKIHEDVRKNIDKNQKEFYLREQLKAIHNELGDDEDEKNELLAKIDAKNMPEEVKEKLRKEITRMGKMYSSSPEYNVIRLYIDSVLELPWGEYTVDREKLSDAIDILNEDHYGLEKIKQRIVEYLAVIKLTNGLNAPILCFIGPPGVGKTSIVQSIARALDRKFVRMSLGGVKDESEIRGHRKTYIGSMPGRIIEALKIAGSSNPVFLLDEVDKLSSDMRGDPASALLEVLDPAQNTTFRDRYLEVPYDLSKVLFITTANNRETIPAPLLDRMEVIELTGYTREEKVEIAKRYLVPKHLSFNGLDAKSLKLSSNALNSIITGYTLEAGVRELERQIDAVCRKVAVAKASGKQKSFLITENNIEKYLGKTKYDREKLIFDVDRVGVATGLAWTAVGGTTLEIEVSTMRGKGEIMLTGKLGDVMKESARAAISYIRSNADKYGINDEIFENTNIHVHVPEGATPKDGPSAGITMATAILSAFSGKPVKKSVAMTGEITLRGKVLPIGGLKEKALAAFRIGISDVIIPNGNVKDIEELPESVKKKLNFIPVSEIEEVFEHAIIRL